MSILFFLLLFPAFAALLLLLFRQDCIRGAIVRISAILIAAASIYFAWRFLPAGVTHFSFESSIVSHLMMVVEAGIGILIMALGLKYKKYLAVLLALVQTPLLLWFELRYSKTLSAGSTFAVDTVTVVMALIIGVVGSLICIYAIGYMKDFQHEHSTEKDRRPIFFFLMFIFLSAMFGIIFTNNLVWLYFFWEITTLCSFLHIGYTKTEEAVNNSFKALTMNLFGGLGFVLAIVYLGVQYQTVYLDQMLAYGAAGINVAIPVLLLALAGLTKSAQLPFSGWLLGAMVAPTPVSALLHSSTMVKAGVYLVLRISPLLGFTVQGIMVMLIGGITFMLASFIAISQSNAKKVLAYSTVANLGLIVACAGIGSYEALWAAIFLMIFHAVAKALMFMCVGSVEHKIGSRNIEDMDGLFAKQPKLAVLMVIGITGMFLAPFGMLISKWAAMKAFVDSGNILIVLMLVFGSAATLFFWTKWLGKLSALMSGSKRDEQPIHKDEMLILMIQAVLTVGLCLVFPIISSFVVEPYLNGIFGVTQVPISQNNLIIMGLMIGLIGLLLLSRLFTVKGRKVSIYLAGLNQGDDLTFDGSLGRMRATHSNWYMEQYFGEKKLSRIGVIVTTAVLLVVYALAIQLI